MKIEKPVYLDCNATTPLLPEAVRAMRPFLEEEYGNPSSIHSWGRAARAAVDEARTQLAGLIGAKSKEIVFTSGGTESNNLAIFGIAHALRKKGRHIITCATEHHAVLHPCKRLESEGFEVTYLQVDPFGCLDIGRLARAMRPETILISIMSANNETGTCHPVPEIGALCRSHKIAFHCDAIQSFGKETVNVEEWNTDLLSIAAHKFYGPKGAGLLYVRSGTPIEAVQLGGFHENERRAGTENVAAIVGMAAAAKIVSEKTGTEKHHLFALTEKFWGELFTAVPNIHRNGHPTQRLGNTLNVSFENCDGEGLLMGLDLEGVAVSSGSACMVGSIQPSHVLRAMGMNEALIRATVRFSHGSDSREDEIPDVVARVARVVERLRKNR